MACEAKHRFDRRAGVLRLGMLGIIWVCGRSGAFEDFQGLKSQLKKKDGRLMTSSVSSRSLKFIYFGTVQKLHLLHFIAFLQRSSVAGSATLDRFPAKAAVLSSAFPP